MNESSALKKQLQEEYRYRIEMHAHTKPVSPCSQIPPEELVRVYKHLGYDAVALTNHFFIGLQQEKSCEEALEKFMQGFYETKKAGDAAGLLVYLGAELRFDGSMNDYLIYGVDEKILKKTYHALSGSVTEYHKTVQDQRSILFQAHPFRDGCEPVSPDALDGIEAFNVHPGHNSRVGFASAYAEKYGLKKIVGTDFHHPGHEGLGGIRTKILPEDSFALAEVLQSGDYLLEVGGTIMIP